MKEPHVIVHKGVPVSTLNPRLIAKQKLTDADIEEIKQLHVKKLDIFEEMENTEVVDALRDLAKEVELTEFALQRAWHFPENADFHAWYRVPKCLCPKLDNQDYYGTKFRIYSHDCPIHSHFNQV